MSENEFKSWAVVEVMGHSRFAGYTTVETIAGVAMLRVDVPQIANIPAFTKYIAPGALYGLTPATEETCRATADRIRAKPFDIWGVEQVLVDQMRAKGMLIEHRPDEQAEGEDHAE
jgi:hypothetical protein